MKILNLLWLYLRYTKPKVWLLLVFVGAVGAVLASRNFGVNYFDLIIIAIVSLIAGSAGSEALTNYIDRDIDSIMLRTRRRPLVTGEIAPLKGLGLGLILVISSILILVAFGRFIAAGFMSVGIIDNVIIYSYLLKRRTPWSIVLGGFSGGFPVIVGWYTVTSAFSIIPWLLFTLVVVWIPVHIWSLAYRYKDDYKRARIPMLPVVFSNRTSAVCISFSALLLVAFSILPYYFGEDSITYILVVALISVPLIFFAISFARKKDQKSSFTLFKYSSPYLTLIFILFLVLKLFK